MNDSYYSSLPINSIEVCFNALIDYDDLPPNDQEKLENLCNAMNIATVAYKTSVDANDVDSTMHWEAEIAKIQESINNLLEGNRNFI